MRRVVQEVYGEIAGLQAEDPLFVHRHAKGRQNAILILVHGLGGDRYTYWGKTPGFLFEDFPNSDVGVYHYRTGRRRLGFGKSIELEAEAKVLAAVLDSELAAYKRIILITHSMGGVLTRSAIAQMMANSCDGTLNRLAGVVMFACPQIGSLRAPPWSRFLSADLRALSIHNDLVQRVSAALADHSSVDARVRAAWRYWIPMYCGLAAEDIWVDPLSASICLPSSQRADFRGNHGSVARPGDKDSGSYVWLRRTLDALLIRPLLHTELNEELVVTRSLVSDFTAIQRIADDAFGSDAVSGEDVSAALQPIDGALMVVRRREASATGTTEKVVGFTCVMPLTQEAASLVRSETLLGKDITARHLASSLEAAAAIYVGAIVGEDLGARALALEELKWRLRSVTVAGNCPIFTRPYTPQGLGLVTRHGFAPVSGKPGIGALYISDLRAVLSQR